MIPVVVLFGGWLAYGLASGDSLVKLVGLEVPASTVKEAATSGTPELFLLWIAIYLGTPLLPWFPAWFLTIVGVGARRVRQAIAGNAIQSVFFLAVIVPSAGYFLIAAQHSGGSDYNYPTISRAWGVT